MVKIVAVYIITLFAFWLYVRVGTLLTCGKHTTASFN